MNIIKPDLTGKKVEIITEKAEKFVSVVTGRDWCKNAIKDDMWLIKGSIENMVYARSRDNMVILD